MVTAAPTDVILDAYSGLGHKALVGDTTTRTLNWAPGWTPPIDHRRLAAYRVLAAYMSNSARHMLTNATEGELRDHREYGEAKLLVDRVAAGILGETWEIVVDGADVDLPDEPELPDAPDLGDEPAVPDADPTPGAPVSLERVRALRQQQVRALRQQRYEAAVNEAIEAWIVDTETQPMLRRRQEALREWADRQGLAGKRIKAETDAVGLGDVVYVLWPGAPGEWPQVTTYEPDGYFPVLDDSIDDFPRKVHLCWELEVTNPDGTTGKRLRRQTWELVDLTGLHTEVDSRGNVDWRRDVDGNPTMLRGATIDADGVVRRNYPWQLDTAGQPVFDEMPDFAADPTGGTTRRVERRSRTTCVYTDAWWRWDELGARKVDDLDVSKATIDRREDLGCDFIPVVHQPNTPAGDEHFGQSVLLPVAQVLDDLAATDSDLASAREMTAVPMVTVSGAKAEDVIVVQPGTVVRLGEKGALGSLDISGGVGVLRAEREALLDTYLVNGRVPASLIGRVDGSTDVAGITVLLSFGPFTQLIGTLRMAREPKDRILLRMVQRLAQVSGALPPGPTPAAHVAYGNYLPMDRSGVVAEVAALLTAGAISTTTAVQVLVAAGYPIDDARAEVDRIRSEDTEGAKNIADATASEVLAARHLGLELPADAAPTGLPVVQLTEPPA